VLGRQLAANSAGTVDRANRKFSTKSWLNSVYINHIEAWVCAHVGEGVVASPSRKDPRQLKLARPGLPGKLTQSITAEDSTRTD